MIVTLRRRWGELLVGGVGQIVLLGLAIHSESREGWIACLFGIAALSFFAWLGALRRWRAVADTPTSQVASAAQGYVELAGRARNHASGRIIAPQSHLPCCWYRYRVEERTSGRKGWRTVDEGESVASFLLVDRTGEVTIEPEGAEVLTRSTDTWQRGDVRYTEWLILDNDPLYALGEFGTRRPAPTARDAHEDIGELLAAWKTDTPELLRRFDANRDGRLEFEEWMLARAEAKGQVDRAHAELREIPAYDVVTRPADGRLYLLSNLDPAKLTRKYFFIAWAHLAALFAGLLAGLYLMA
jgi:hypothetical protein